jgi:predicted DCC family thiol-disulfide oxidoreductase YuxK
MTSATTPEPEPSTSNRPAVFFDGSCPLCRREIAVYRKRDRTGAVDWVDVSSCQAARMAPDLSREDAKRRFHMRRADGTLLSGAAAFAEMWVQTPGFRWLGRVARWPGVTSSLEVAYRGFLRVRPQMQRVAVWLERRR